MLRLGGLSVVLLVVVVMAGSHETAHRVLHNEGGDAGEPSGDGIHRHQLELEQRVVAPRLSGARAQHGSARLGALSQQSREHHLDPPSHYTDVDVLSRQVSRNISSMACKPYIHTTLLRSSSIFTQ